MVDGDVDLPRGLAYSFPWRTANVVSMDDRKYLEIIHCWRRCSFFARRQHVAPLESSEPASMDYRIFCSDHSLRYRLALWSIYCCRRCSSFARRQHGRQESIEEWTKGQIAIEKPSTRNPESLFFLACIPSDSQHRLGRLKRTSFGPPDRTTRHPEHLPIPSSSTTASLPDVPPILLPAGFCECKRRFG